jgi:hypothetical protein
MASLLDHLSPAITNLIRLDHTHVLSAFHQYELSGSQRLRRGLADNICLALEIHGQLEEEIFYPALRATSGIDAVSDAVTEHMQLRTLIARLRGMPVTDPSFDDTFFEMMRGAMHHMADEETRLLPTAERHLADQLQELGARMTRRRLQLALPRSGELASSIARSISGGTLLGAASAALAGGGLLARTPRLAARWRQRNSGG